MKRDPVEVEIEQGLARMRAEIGIPQPVEETLPPFSIACFALAFVLVGVVAVGLIR